MPSWTIKLADEILRLDLAAFFSPKPEQGAFVVAHNDAGVGAADEGAAIYGISGAITHRILAFVSFLEGNDFYHAFND